MCTHNRSKPNTPNTGDMPRRGHRGTTTLEWVVVGLVTLGVLGTGIWGLAQSGGGQYQQVAQAVAATTVAVPPGQVQPTVKRPQITPPPTRTPTPVYTATSVSTPTATATNTPTPGPSPTPTRVPTPTLYCYTVYDHQCHDESYSYYTCWPASRCAPGCAGSCCYDDGHPGIHDYCWVTCDCYESYTECGYKTGYRTVCTDVPRTVCQ